MNVLEPTPEHARRELAGIADALSEDDDLVVAYARAVWSCLVEPGDRVGITGGQRGGGREQPTAHDGSSTSSAKPRSTASTTSSRVSPCSRCCSGA